MVMEYDGANAIVSRYVHGNAVGADDPLLWYNGSDTADGAVRNLFADPRGSIVLVQGQDGTAIGINRYDEWGNNEGDASTGRFQYTGQSGSMSWACIIIRPGYTRRCLGGSCRRIPSGTKIS